MFAGMEPKGLTPTEEELRPINSKGKEFLKSLFPTEEELTYGKKKFFGSNVFPKTKSLDEVCDM